MNAPHVVSDESRHRPIQLVPGFWLCSCGWVSDRHMGEALWLLFEARHAAEVLADQFMPSNWPLPWETPKTKPQTESEQT